MALHHHHDVKNHPSPTRLRTIAERIGFRATVGSAPRWSQFRSVVVEIATTEREAPRRRSLMDDNPTSG